MTRPRMIRDDGQIDGAGVMRQAHQTFRYMQRRGWEDWPFERCLRFAWAEARGRKEVDRFAALEAAMRRIVGGDRP